MIGFEKETICMNIEEAKEYVACKIRILENKREELLKELEDIDSELLFEANNLHALYNPPSKQLDCCCSNCGELDYPDIHIVGRASY